VHRERIDRSFEQAAIHYLETHKDKASMTHPYSVAQIVELHAALEKIKDDAGRWNKSPAMLKPQKRGMGDASPKSPNQRKTA